MDTNPNTVIMNFEKTTLMNKKTEILISSLLKQKYEEIEKSGEYWRHEEQEEVLKACDDLELDELKKQLTK